MCNSSNIEFAKAHLPGVRIRQHTILEVGSRDVNGSLRHIIEPLGPRSYIGIDIQPGPGVDELCSVYDLVTRFGRESIDVVVCTEVIEHVRDWRLALSQLKRVLRPGGTLLLTTRSRGFPYHDYPADFWRYEVSDMERLCSDMEILALETDPLEPGVLMTARKPPSFAENGLADYRLYSMIRRKRCRSVGARHLVVFWLTNSVVGRIGRSVAYRSGLLFRK